MKMNESVEPEVLANFVSELAATWSLGRALLEHSRANASPAGERLTEREMLTLALVGEFEGLVTATTLCKVFGLHHSQVGKIVDKLVERELLKKSTDRVAKRSGQGAALQLGAKAKEALNLSRLQTWAEFGYLYKDFSNTELKQMLELTKKTHAAAQQQFKQSVFHIIPPTILKQGN